MPPSGANANSDGGCSIDQTSSQKPRQGFRRSIHNPKCSLVRVTRLCSAWKGVGGNLSPFGANGSPAAARGRSTYFYLGKACSRGNSRGKPIAWPARRRGRYAGFRAWLQSVGRPRLTMDITYNHSNYESKRYTPNHVFSRQ